MLNWGTVAENVPIPIPLKYDLHSVIRAQVEIIRPYVCDGECQDKLVVRIALSVCIRLVLSFQLSFILIILLYYRHIHFLFSNTQMEVKAVTNSFKFDFGSYHICVKVSFKRPC